MKPYKAYISDAQALAFYQQKANAEFWDGLWESKKIENIIRGTKDDGLYIPLVKKYLPKGSAVLEGGCGMGQLVYALQSHGYQIIGVDYATQTVQKINEIIPELDVRIGDVFNLEFADNAFDGYISVGVIEHFWEGYQPILQEMKRVLRSHGYLFISFPHLSFLRRLKIWLNIYPIKTKAEMDKQIDVFYQFALSSPRFIADLEAMGFRYVESIPYAGFKGFKDEIEILRPILQKIYDGKYAKFLWRYFDRVFTPFASHSILLVMQKT